jgi:TolB-like protein
MRKLAVLAALCLAVPGRADDLRTAAERAAADLASALAASPDRAPVRRVAVPPFTETGAAKGQGPAAATAAAARLAQLARVEVVDAAKLSAVVGERRLQVMTGGARADDPDLARLGNVQAVLAGEVQDAGDRLRVSLRLLTTPGNRVLASAAATADLPSQRARAAAVESQHIDVALRKLSAGLAAGFARLPGSALYRRLAVLTFTENGEQAQKRRMGAIVTAEIATDLKRDHNLLLVEREKLGQVLGELKLQQMVSVDPARAGQIGQLADAQALVIGSVSEAGDQYLVNARIVATQTGETLAAESATLPAAGMVALASDAVVLRSRSDAVYRSLLVPGWGQFYNRQPVKAWLVIGTEVALGGAALGYHLAAQSSYDRYTKASSSARAQDLYDEASSRYRTRNWLLVAFGGVWLLNVADAWFSGVDGERLLAGGVAEAPALAPVLLPGGAGAVATLRF